MSNDDVAQEQTPHNQWRNPGLSLKDEYIDEQYHGLPHGLVKHNENRQHMDSTQRHHLIYYLISHPSLFSVPHSSHPHQSPTTTRTNSHLSFPFHPNTAITASVFLPAKLNG